jgi:hypothetical protein
LRAAEARINAFDQFLTEIDHQASISSTSARPNRMRCRSCAGIGQWTDHVEELDDRTRPAMTDDGMQVPDLFVDDVRTFFRGLR